MIITAPAAVSQPTPGQFDPDALVDVNEMMARVFSPESKPSLRFIKTMQKRHRIPYIKLGGRVFYKVREVRAAIDEHAIRARK